MACNTVNMSSAAMAKHVLHRSHSTKDLYDGDGIRRSPSDPQLRCSLNPSATKEHKLKNSPSFKILPFESSGSSMKSVMFEAERSKGGVDFVEESEEEEGVSEQEKRYNWMKRLLELRGAWKNRKHEREGEEEGEEEGEGEGDEGVCEVDYEDEEEVVYDNEMFEIKAEDLRTYYDLHFVTSSLQKKARAAIKANLELDSTCVPLSSSAAEDSMDKIHVRPSVAYEIATTAAAYLHSIGSRAKGLLALGHKSNPNHEDPQMEPQHGESDGENPPKDSGATIGSIPYPSRLYNSEVAAYVAAKTMTSVIAAEETAKQEAAKELQSLHSSPCEWFVCDDPSTYTRCFVIQGSDSPLSWQANLLFEPTKFEGTDTLVHRGIYEAAKGIYGQFMPEIQNHLETYGERARLRFTGHSLGGSLSVLISLMLLTRKIVKPSTLLPVVTFGAPFIFCGGRRILDLMGLDENHIQSVMMHRDIVPRAFSCNYHNHVARILKRLNGSFRSHPCLNKNKMLYTPLGKLYILQPDVKSSPPHPLLPPGSALHELDTSKSTCYAGVASALRAFLNSPHPLETLSDPTAYGSEGTILRDHDSSNYLKAVNSILRQHTKSVVRKSRRERLHYMWPQLAAVQSPQYWDQRNLENFGLAQKEVVAVTGV